MKQKVSLTSTFRDVQHVDEFFGHTQRWGIDRFILSPTDWNRTPSESFWRGQCGPVTKWESYPFGTCVSASLSEMREPDHMRDQLDIADAVYRHCLKQKIEFVFTILLPKFPFNKAEAVQKYLPELYGVNGEMNLAAAAQLSVLQSILDEVCDRYPLLQGFELWVAEGAGAAVHSYNSKNLQEVEAWLPSWCAFLESYGGRKGLEMTIFAHQYEHTRGTRQRVHRIIRRHPSLHLLEDLAWPEEFVALPYMGYLGEHYAKELAKSNPLHINFLLDTEYKGQGRIPSVVPQWIQGGLYQARNIGAEWVNGRVNFWDDNSTLDSWNILNTDVFCALARDPDQDVRALLQDSVTRRFDSTVAIDFAGLLMESQRLILLSQTMNGVSFMDHSAFPLPQYLHRSYFNRPQTMKAVDDLFAAPGTPLFGAGGDDMKADREWRQQLSFVTRSVDDYLREKDTAITEIQLIGREIEAVSIALSDQDAAFISKSYAIWLEQARATRLFVEAAAAHVEWVSEGCRTNTSLDRLSSLSTPMEALASRFSQRFGEKSLFELSPRMLNMARFIRQPTPVNL